MTAGVARRPSLQQGRLEAGLLGAEVVWRVAAIWDCCGKLFQQQTTQGSPSAGSRLAGFSDQVRLLQASLVPATAASLQGHP